MLTGTVVLDLHFIGSPSPRVFTKNRFPQFSPVHELGEFQWQSLNLMALRTGDAEEGVHSGRRRRNDRRRSTWTWRSRWHLGFIFTPGRTAGAPLHQSGRRSYRSCDSILVLTAARAAVAPLLHWGADVQMRSTCISHGAKCWKEETLDEMKERKMMRRRKNLMTELGFFTLTKLALFISTY
jgi:hypothetical protein